jgi:hypothetical protein
VAIPSSPAFALRLFRRIDFRTSEEASFFWGAQAAGPPNAVREAPTELCVDQYRDDLAKMFAASHRERQASGLCSPE